ncbi:hypothetical protein M5K25_011253 [Dendrobium thyrsiflorum]|uniref:Uncharacterized protein n=1 Tax=Dendrobium thyrsiflorum TaxID=117978 RepID=A0ABD0V9D1_DENTH
MLLLRFSLDMLVLHLRWDCRFYFLDGCCFSDLLMIEQGFRPNNREICNISRIVGFQPCSRIIEQLLKLSLY